jgi:uncharacterized membrane protein
MKESHELLGRWLTSAMAVSAASLVAGLALAFVDRARGLPDLGPHPLLDVGLVVLMVTPLVRILFSLSEEIRARNWFFVGITLIVVAVLGATLWTAVRSGC